MNANDKLLRTITSIASRALSGHLGRDAEVYSDASAAILILIFPEKSGEHKVWMPLDIALRLQFLFGTMSKSVIHRTWSHRTRGDKSLSVTIHTCEGVGDESLGQCVEYKDRYVVLDCTITEPSTKRGYIQILGVTLVS